MENEDFCCIDGTRCFVLANLQIPVAGLSSPWILTLWAEIPSDEFGRFLDSYAQDASGQEPIDGVIANYLDAFPHASGSRVKVHLGSSERRATLVTTDPSSDIGKAQHLGLSEQELHDLLAIMNYDETS